MARQTLAGPATPVDIVKGNISIDVGDITIGTVGIADGGDVAEGATTDAAVITDADGTISSKLRGIITQMVSVLSRIPAALTAGGNLKVAVLEALPAGTDVIGKVVTADGVGVLYDGITALTVKDAIISAATNGNNTLVAAVPGKKIVVLSLWLVAAAAVTIRFESAADGTAKSGVASLAANGGMVLNHNPEGWFRTAATELLNLELGGAVQVSGSLTYVEV